MPGTVLFPGLWMNVAIWQVMLQLSQVNGIKGSQLEVKMWCITYWSVYFILIDKYIETKTT